MSTRRKIQLRETVTGGDPSAVPSATLIVLHGLGAEGRDFAPLVNELDLSSAGPVRFVFPTAPVRPVTLNRFQVRYNNIPGQDKPIQPLEVVYTGGYIQDDLYVFVIGIEDGIVHAHGGQPRQVGRKVADIVDATGKRFLEEMIDVARQKGEGEVRYTFRNPLTLKNENKRSYIVRVGKYLVGAGAYVGPAQQ